MNDIYWQTDRIGILTNQINAEEHSHLMLQLFLRLEGLMEVEIYGEKLKCKCIIVDKNTPHAIHTKHELIFSILIAPTSSIVSGIQTHIHSHGYWICDMADITFIQKEAQKLALEKSITQYVSFSEKLYNVLNIKPTPQTYDPRIALLLELIENCNCDNHAISAYASELALSPSRLSHLFKAETGIPLKSYIILHQMERAFTDLLIGKNITEAAMDAGFDSPSHFATTVKRMMGMPASLSIKDSVFLKVNSI